MINSLSPTLHEVSSSYAIPHFWELAEKITTISKEDFQDKLVKNVGFPSEMARLSIIYQKINRLKDERGVVSRETTISQGGDWKWAEALQCHRLFTDLVWYQQRVPNGASSTLGEIDSHYSEFIEVFTERLQKLLERVKNLTEILKKNSPTDKEGEIDFADLSSLSLLLEAMQKKTDLNWKEAFLYQNRLSQLARYCLTHQSVSKMDSLNLAQIYNYFLTSYQVEVVEEQIRELEEKKSLSLIRELDEKTSPSRLRKLKGKKSSSFLPKLEEKESPLIEWKFNEKIKRLFDASCSQSEEQYESQISTCLYLIRCMDSLEIRNLGKREIWNYEDQVKNRAIIIRLFGRSDLIEKDFKDSLQILIKLEEKLNEKGLLEAEEFEKTKDTEIKEILAASMEKLAEELSTVREVIDYIYAHKNEKSPESEPRVLFASSSSSTESLMDFPSEQGHIKEIPFDKRGWKERSVAFLISCFLYFQNLLTLLRGLFFDSKSKNNAKV